MIKFAVSIFSETVSVGIRGGEHKPKAQNDNPALMNRCDGFILDSDTSLCENR